MSSTKRHHAAQLDSVSSTGDPATRRRILDAALALITARGGGDVTMAEVAVKAGVSRQAIYLHFADGAALAVAVVDDFDRRRGIAAAIGRVRSAPSGIDAAREMVAIQARMNPGVWPIARAFDAVRRRDESAERAWQSRVDRRLDACRSIVARMARERTLRSGLDQRVAADLLWTMTSLRMWEDLVVQRGWSAEEYVRRVSDLIVKSLTTGSTVRRGKGLVRAAVTC